MFRAPFTGRERRKRETARLTPLQRYYLELWGYPYVLSEFRPHFTLTNALSDAHPIEKALRWDFQMRVPSPILHVDTLTLFGERESDGRFEVVREFPIGRRRRHRRVAAPVAAAAFLD